MRRNKGAGFRLLQPLVSLRIPNNQRGRLQQARVLRRHRSFCLKHGPSMLDVCSPGSIQEEEEGVVCSAAGRVIHIRRLGTSMGMPAADCLDRSTRAPSRQGEVLPVTSRPAEIFD